MTEEQIKQLHPATIEARKTWANAQVNLAKSIIGRALDCNPDLPQEVRKWVENDDL